MIVRYFQVWIYFSITCFNVLWSVFGHGFKPSINTQWSAASWEMRWKCFSSNFLSSFSLLIPELCFPPLCIKANGDLVQSDVCAACQSQSETIDVCPQIETQRFLQCLETMNLPGPRLWDRQSFLILNFFSFSFLWSWVIFTPIIHISTYLHTPTVCLCISRFVWHR